MNADADAHRTDDGVTKDAANAAAAAIVRGEIRIAITKRTADGVAHLEAARSMMFGG